MNKSEFIQQTVIELIRAGSLDANVVPRKACDIADLLEEKGVVFDKLIEGSAPGTLPIKTESVTWANGVNCKNIYLKPEHDVREVFASSLTCKDCVSHEKCCRAEELKPCEYLKLAVITRDL